MNHEEKPTHLDLFSGIGGFSIAAEKAGFKTIGFAEIEPYPCGVIRSKWPNVPNYGNIGNIRREFSQFRNIALLTAGFPCQPFSHAGAMRGTSDERFLWPELARIVGEIRPKVALFENVPALLTIESGSTFNRIMSDLVALGYHIAWNCVPACAVGANHQRDRLWIVAYSGLLGSSKHEIKTTGPEQLGKTHAHASAVLGEALKRIEQIGILRSVRHPDGQGLERQWQISSRTKSKHEIECGKSWWESEPDVGRMANGVSNRVDRLKSLGNAIVPACAEIFLKAIRKIV